MPTSAEQITPQLAAIGQAIRETRESRKLTQAALAEAIGVTQAAVAGWELGRRAPAIVDIPKIAFALRIIPSALATRILKKIADCTC